MRITPAFASTTIFLSACTSMKPVGAGETVAPASSVAVTFASERDLEAMDDSVVYSLPAVSTVYGRVERASADTVILRDLKVLSSRRQATLPRTARLTVVPRDSARLTLRQPARGKTVGLLGGLTLLLFLLIGVATVDEI